jgi:hypothetical protein
VFSVKVSGQFIIFLYFLGLLVTVHPPLEWNFQVLSDLHRSKKECSSCGPRRIWFYPTPSSRIPTSGVRSFPQYL